MDFAFSGGSWTGDRNRGERESDDFHFSTLTGFEPGTYLLWDTQSPITGTLGSSLSGTVGGLPATLAMADGTNDIVLIVVPEPSSSVLCLAGLDLLRRRRRRV